MIFFSSKKVKKGENKNTAIEGFTGRHSNLHTPQQRSDSFCDKSSSDNLEINTFSHTIFFPQPVEQVNTVLSDPPLPSAVLWYFPLLILNFLSAL